MTTKSSLKRQKKHDKATPKNRQSRIGPRTALPLRLSPELPPPLHELGAETFQGLCRDLLDSQPEVESCDLYGTSGQKQRGIDLIAKQKNGSGIWVAQCKAYRDIKPATIQKASDHFFRHIDFWREHGVNRFFLHVGCSLTRTQIQDQLAAERCRFAAHGIKYVYWDAHKIANLLGPNRYIANKYLPEDWTNRLCGGPLKPVDSIAIPSSYMVVQACLTAQIESVSEILEQDSRKELDRIKLLANEGHTNEAISALREMRSTSARWTVLGSLTRARLLRMLAELLIISGHELSEIKQLLSAADEFDPTIVPTAVHAQLVFREKGPEAALALLANRPSLADHNARAGFLLTLSRPQATLDELQFAGTSLEPDVETLRLRALAYLCLGDLAPARLNAETALEKSPKCVAVRFTAAIIDYFSCLSSAVQPHKLVPWPFPVGWEVVRRDEKSALRLKRAEATFTEFASNEDLRPEERRIVETWRLACMAINPQKGSEAERYCQSLLNDHPANGPVLIWALTRKWRFSPPSHIKALSKLIRLGGDHVVEALALISIYSISGKVDDAINALNSTRQMFESSENSDLWHSLRVQVLIDADRIEDAKSEFGEDFLQQKPNPAIAHLLLAYAQKTGKFEKYIDYVQRLYDERQDVASLLEACMLLAKRGLWDLIARQINFLRSIQTADCVRLASIAAWNIGETQTCLEILVKGLDHFSDKKLTEDLRELRINCLRKLGLLSDAAAEAESLAGEDPSTINIANLVNILISKLDTHGATAVAQKLLGRRDLTADIALNIAGLLQSESTDLARALWKQTVTTNLEDRLVTLAYKLGSQLGLTTELQPLNKRIAEAAERGDTGIAQKITLDDFLKMIEEERQRFHNFDRLYRSAEIPLQLMADAQSIPLVYPYHQGLADRAVSPEDRSMLLARWGGRAQVTIFPDKIQEIRLFADVSSLLMANHLDILDTIESQLGPIHIAPATTGSLLSIRDQLIPIQPSRINAIRNVIDLISKNNIIADNSSPASVLETIPTECVKTRGVVWAKQVSRAILEDGFILDLSGFQFQSDSSIVSPLLEEMRSRFVTCSTVSRSLAKLGFLSNDQLETALTKLGSEGVLRSNDSLLNQGTRVYIQSYTAIAMAEAEILDFACSAFRFHVDLDDYQNLVHELQQSDQRSILREWVESLRERLRQGIDQGRYLIQSIPPAPKKTTEYSMGPCATSLDQLLRNNRQPRDVLWIDDRAIGRLSSMEPISVVCTSDVLKSAFHYGVIDAPQYYRSLIQLRREGVYFIPTDSAELLYHLGNATIREGEILETEELYTLRKYFAQAFESKFLLFAGNKSPGEEQFVLTLLNAVDDSLVSIWKSERTLEEKQMFSRWLWCSFGLHEVPGLRGEITPSPEALAMRLASLLGRTLAFGAEEKNIAQRNEYLAWLENHLIAPRLAADPAFAQTIAGLLKRGTLSLLLKKDNGESKEEHEAIKAVTSDFIDALPQTIALEVNRDPFLMKALGRWLRAAVSIGSWKFSSPEIWDAASRAISEGHSEAETLNGKTALIEANIATETHITLRFNVSGTIFEIPDPLNGLLLSSVDIRRQTLQMIRSTFDVNDSLFASRSAEISLIDKCDERMNAALSWLHESTATYYQHLEDRVQADPKFRWSDLLPPPSASMLGRYRLEMSGLEFAENLEKGAEILLKEVGLELALERFIALPLCLPDPIIQKLHTMEATERHTTLMRIAQTSASPVACFHILRLLLNEPEDSEIKQVVTECLDYLAYDGIASCNALLTLLQFAFEELSIRRDAKDLTISLRLTLAWAHAHELFTVFQKHGISNDWIIGLRSLRPPIPFEVFGRNPEVFQDIAYPRALHPEALLMFGLAYAIEEAPSSTLSQIQERDLSGRFTRVLNSGGMKAPALTLLKNRHLGRNSLSSFLVWRPAIENILGADAAAFINPDILKEHARIAIDKLSENIADLDAWAILSCIVGEFDPGDDLRELLKSFIQNADFSGQVFDTEMVGRVMIALNFLCQQRAYSKGMGSIDLKPHIMRIAERIDHLDQKTAHHDKADFELGLFLEACVLSTTIPSDPVSSARGFAQLTSEVVRVCPGIAQLARNVFQRLCDGLPVGQSQELWSVLTHLRTFH